MDWMIGGLGSIAVAGAAYRKKSLSGSGAAAAVFMGTLFYALGSLAWFGTLLVFFISSTLWSKYKRKAKAKAESGYEKSGRRDAAQVLANGGIGLVLCVAHAIWPHDAWFWLFVGTMATVNADTWATEIGGLSRSAPRSIVNWRPVPAGASGGITPLGTAAALAGSMLIGAAAWLLQAAGEGSSADGWSVVAIAGIAGMFGAMLDSLLGATCQMMYRCPTCGKVMERKTHCGVPAIKYRGMMLMDNDAVNAVSSVGGAAVSLLLAQWIL